ncbi:hypothetical protein AB0O07_10665 [Streptomyces sp. NPDC093085]|uniref:hypothetical protein n=1 Tax=Streptomyces sp. NPDC093085 TaxID=3155068 RepID=UPI00343F1F04
MRLRSILVATALAAASLSVAVGGTAAADDNPQIIAVFTPPPICTVQNGSSMVALINPSGAGDLC